MYFLFKSENKLKQKQHFNEPNSHHQNKWFTFMYFGHETQVAKIYKDTDTRIFILVTNKINKWTKHSLFSKIRYWTPHISTVQNINTRNSTPRQQTAALRTSHQEMHAGIMPIAPDPHGHSWRQHNLHTRTGRGKKEKQTRKQHITHPQAKTSTNQHMIIGRILWEVTMHFGESHLKFYQRQTKESW